MSTLELLSASSFHDFDDDDVDKPTLMNEKRLGIGDADDKTARLFSAPLHELPPARLDCATDTRRAIINTAAR